MANRQPIKTKDLDGLFIYQDPKKGTIYYDIFTRRGYILTSSDIKTYSMYSSSFYFCILIAFLLMYTFKLTYVDTILIFIALYILIQVIFRITFLYKLPVIENYQPPKKEKVYISIANKYSSGRLIFLLLAFLALTILMPIYAYTSNMTNYNKIASYLLSFMTLVASIITLLAIISKRKS